MIKNHFVSMKSQGGQGQFTVKKCMTGMEKEL